MDMDIVEILSQLIHLCFTCKVTSQSFLVTFIYSFNTIVPKRDMWNQLRSYESGRTQPWLVLGDFNSVLRREKKRNREPITPYLVKDLEECCLATGVVEIVSSGCFYTWTNHTVWSKLDRVMMNDVWA